MNVISIPLKKMRYTLLLSLVLAFTSMQLNAMLIVPFELSMDNEWQHLRRTVQAGNLQDVVDLINNAPDEKRISYITNALERAAEFGNAEIFTDLINHYPEVCTQKQLEKALYNAASSGQLTTLKLALKKGAHIEVTQINNITDTPLLQAAGNGHIEVVRYLIEQGANVNAITAFTRKTALLKTLQNNHFETANAILNTIPLAERQKLHAILNSIMTGLLAINRSKPTPARDIRQIITKMIIAPLIKDHMEYAAQLLDDANALVSPNQLLNINTLRTPEKWQTLQHDVEFKIRHILFHKPQESVYK